MNFSRLTVVELRHELKQRGLSTAGKKADLVERLTAVESTQIGSPLPVPDNHSTEKPALADACETIHEDGLGPESLTAVNDFTEKSKSIKTPEAPENTESSPRGPDSAEDTEPVEDSTLAENPEPTGVAEAVKSSEPFKNLESNAKLPASDSTTNAHKSENNETNGVLAPLCGPEPMDSAPAQATNVDETTDDKKDDPVSLMAVDEPSPDLSKDARGRKRRSRTPPPSDDESSPKRSRLERPNADAIQDIDGSAPAGQEVLPLDDDPSGEDCSYAKLVPDTSIESREGETATIDATNQDRNEDDSSQTGLEVFEEDYGKVEPSIHHPTRALFIKNFMRPLKEAAARDHLVELATPPGRSSDDNVIQQFFLDHLRSHVFVTFDSVAAAKRARALIHTKVWPKESTRKALWADFVPPDRIPDWIEVEEQGRKRGGPSSRWEVIYEKGNDGEVRLELIDTNDPENRHKLRGEQAMSIPTGPARQFSGIEGAPSGPRGHGAFRDSQGGRGRTPISFNPVSDHLIRLRLNNIRNLQTTDRYRKMGRNEDKKRYTFENNDMVVSRGVGDFARIPRPPPRWSRGYRRQRGPPRFAPPMDRYNPGRDRFPARDVPRSRFDGTPLPTYGGGGGSRRPAYWNHR